MLTLAATQFLQKSDLRTLEVVGLILLAGLLSTFRIVFFFLPLLVGFAFSNVRRRRAVALAFGSLSLSLVFQVVFFLLNRASYPPLELLQEKIEDIFACDTRFAIESALLLGLRCSSTGGHGGQSRTSRWAWPCHGPL